MSKNQEGDVSTDPRQHPLWNDFFECYHRTWGSLDEKYLKDAPHFSEFITKCWRMFIGGAEAQVRATAGLVEKKTQDFCKMLGSL